MIEDGSPIRIENNAGTLAFRNQADDTDLTLPAPAAHTDSVHSGAAANLLTALTPAFANWTTNPGTAANIVDELSNAVLTTNGVGAAGNNTVIYDLGDSRRRIVSVRSEELMSVSISDSNGSYQATAENKPAQGIYTAIGIGKFRWVQFTWVGVLTVSEIKARCYNIN